MKKKETSAHEKARAIRPNHADIFTPQGRLADVEKHPNLDFLMNLFNIPRAFGVSGFGGNWTVGKHSFATALIALYWAKYCNFSPERRDRLVTEAILHDAHEAVTGDILPMFKSDDVRAALDKVQNNITKSLGVEEDETLAVDLKIIDMVSFLYEIKQVSPSIIHPKQLALAHMMAERQQEVLLAYCDRQKVSRAKAKGFLRMLEI